jgi:hypothetical protein
MATAEMEEELIDGLTFDEWMDMIPVGVEDMTETEKAAALKDVNVRVAAIREERFGGKPWQEAVYGKWGGRSSDASGDPLMVAEPPGASYGPTGTPEQDAILERAEAYRKAGGKFIPAEECIARMKATIERTKNA